jgi:hypothetical protein
MSTSLPQSDDAQLSECDQQQLNLQPHCLTPFRAPFRAPGVFRTTLGVGLQKAVEMLISSSRTLEVGLRNKRPSFECFHKIMSIEGKESATITANDGNNNNEMSSLVAAASGRR